jgi:hypothetical protein
LIRADGLVFWIGERFRGLQVARELWRASNVTEPGGLRAPGGRTRGRGITGLGGEQDGWLTRTRSGEAPVGQQRSDTPQLRANGYARSAALEQPPSPHLTHLSRRDSEGRQEGPGPAPARCPAARHRATAREAPAAEHASSVLGPRSSWRCAPVREHRGRGAARPALHVGIEVARCASSWWS